MDNNSPDRFNPRRGDVIVAVMGMTGSGKSTLISLCTDQPVEVGHDLQACTQQVAVYKCCYNDSTDVYMIDTPGFDDTNRSDTDILKNIATWLTKSYEKNIRLNGMLYMHRITDTRMGGSAKKNLFMFKKLCGPNAMENILLVTTMWENVDYAIGVSREEELIQTTDFWGLMLQQGASIERHRNNRRDSAMRLLAHFVNKETTTMAIQSEMVNDKKLLHETTAGQELDSELIVERERFQKELEETKEMFRQAIELQDLESANQLREHEKKMTEKIERIRREREELKVNMKKMHESSEERVKQLEKKLKEQGRALKELALRTNPPQEKIPSTAVSSQNRINEPNVSISLAGSGYAFVGPAWSKFTRPHDTSNNRGRCDTYISLGTNGSWYRHYHADGNGYTKYSSNLKTEYPELYDWLQCSSKSRKCCPTQISLGPNRKFYARVGKAWKYSLPSGIQTKEEDFNKVRRIWLGFGGAYVIERFSGEIKQDLKGHYAGLEKDIGMGMNGCKKIKDLAMNIEHSAYYAVIMADSSSSSLWGPMFPSLAWKEYMTRNFATRWD